MLIVPKGWREFQHYKDRSPPWIRLHRKLLDNRDFHKLPVGSRALAPMLWLLASESVDGVIDADMEELAFRLRSNEKDVKSALLPLLERGFFLTLQDDSETLADRKHAATPETEGEAEAFTETEADLARAVARPTPKPSKSGIVWTAFSAAFAGRYGTEPARNAKVNGQLAQLVDRLGDDAPLVAAFYLTHSDPWYVKHAHSAGLLLRDAEKLHMEWKTGRTVSAATRAPGQGKYAAAGRAIFGNSTPEVIDADPH
jgi:hypothetical protein